MTPERSGETDILEIIKSDPWMMDVLKAVRELNLPDSWVAAGFVRNKIWDHLHGYKARTELSDVDVIYFDPANTDWSKEKVIEARLRKLVPDIPWSAKNQARMHTKNEDTPYKDSADAVSRWVETPTCIGVRLEKDGSLSLLAPHGIDDLMNLIVRPNPGFKKDLSIYEERIANKGWQQKWPRLRIIHSR